ncbi:MAG TPA: RNB domain-containing ribonuclease [Candidatus Saccharimonadales bacterium]|nr:RNB domain-containing ribonuclease [Candidatus Saccharimonadales bacterium]
MTQQEQVHTTGELRDAALRAASEFELPPNWHAYREYRTGVALTERHTSEVNRILSVDETADTTVLCMSMSDVGSYLVGNKAIKDHAFRMGWTIQTSNNHTVGMLPWELSLDKLSLVPGALRPALTVGISVGDRGEISMPRISRDVARARQYTFAEASALIADGRAQDATLLGIAGDVAVRLFAARHGYDFDSERVYSFEDVYLEDEHGHMLEEFDPAAFILQESIIACNAAVAMYMRAHKIPALHYNQVLLEPPDDLEDRDYEMFLAQAGGLRFKTYYDVESAGHVTAGADAYARADAPLSRFDDFVNVSNLAAHLEGRINSYDERRLRTIGIRLNKLLARETALSSVDDLILPLESELVSQRKIEKALQKFESGEVAVAELATTIFDMADDDPAARAIAQAAAKYVLEHPEVAINVLNVAEARNLITRQLPVTGDTTRPEVMHVIVDQHGNTHSYAPRTGAIQRTLDAAEIIAAVADVETIGLRERVILQNGVLYLNILAQEKCLELRNGTTPLEGGRVHAYVKLMIHGVWYEYGAEGDSTRTAMREACRTAIQQHDLLNNPPEKQRKHNVPHEPLQNPIVLLAGRQRTAGAEQAEYEFPKTDGPAKCVVRAVDIDGTPYECEGTGTSKKLAKQAAAAALLAVMPRRPLNKRGDMYKI